MSLQKYMPIILDTTYSVQEMEHPIAAVLECLNCHPDKQEWRMGVSGELGTGKTTLFQHFLKTLNTRDPTLAQILTEPQGQSPTYIYLKSYEGKKYCVWHVDAYRLAPKIWQEILSTWEEEMGDRKYILWVEWYELISNDTPDISIQLRFPKNNSSNQRDIKILSTK